MQSGPNGLTILMMTLYWWSLTVGEFDSDLEFALKDVAWVFETMLASDMLIAVRKRDQASDLLSPSKALTTDTYRVVVKHTTSASSPRKHTRSSQQDMPPPCQRVREREQPLCRPVHSQRQTRSIPASQQARSHLSTIHHQHHVCLVICCPNSLLFCLSPVFALSRRSVATPCIYAVGNIYRSGKQINNLDSPRIGFTRHRKF